MIYHVLLRAYPGSAAQHAPSWAAAFDYRRFAVVIFIVPSGFPLGVARRAGPPVNHYLI